MVVKKIPIEFTTRYVINFYAEHSLADEETLGAISGFLDMYEEAIENRALDVPEAADLLECLMDLLGITQQVIEPAKLPQRMIALCARMDSTTRGVDLRKEIVTVREIRSWCWPRLTAYFEREQERERERERKRIQRSQPPLDEADIPF
ncbi:hypothetical protein INH39_02790 [Massilia violaceinigra]|uniref:Uncharacterized protein n=1 Tax=Massilia violaceinigra TaxID=2045208 RepID=A0ABY4A978_9BURK|nr:hypothetical protein [Massilia violaceinigra]UOD30690.1 hypothetical protein INH39_02790 [Massilia violaceinigra]